MKKAFTQLGDTADKVDVAMTTIDPDRDTGETFSAWAKRTDDEAVR